MHSVIDFVKYLVIKFVFENSLSFKVLNYYYYNYCSKGQIFRHDKVLSCKI